MYSNILVTYDGSELSKKSIEVAASFAKENPSLHVEVIYVSNIPYVVVGEGVFIPTPAQTVDYLASSQAIQDEVKELVASIPNSTVVVKEGPVVKTILDHANAIKSDLIIIGSKGHSAIGEFVLGSVSHNVVQHSKIPVLIVK
ncbi:universal stress protein [Brevibacillus ginsengisoli]|uniref:universal stress protein n=1 Tax=Brevibacillus ginsengisoli TaxID=363854 RepID=UPI003CEF52D2